uniref:Uncharacterized protein n=1 Tax=Heterorhabditis bacteriophora TaxID=37862 RepID=A0A1I7WYD4_HETBA
MVYEIFAGNTELIGERSISLSRLDFLQFVLVYRIHFISSVINNFNKLIRYFYFLITISFQLLLIILNSCFICEYGPFETEKGFTDRLSSQMLYISINFFIIPGFILVENTAITKLCFHYLYCAVISEHRLNKRHMELLAASLKRHFRLFEQYIHLMVKRESWIGLLIHKLSSN